MVRSGINKMLKTQWGGSVSSLGTSIAYSGRQQMLNAAGAYARNFSSTALFSALGINYHTTSTHDGSGGHIPFLAATLSGTWIGNFNINGLQTGSFEAFNSSDYALNDVINEINGDNDSQSISLSIAGAFGDSGVGYAVGYFWGENTSGFYVSKMTPEKNRKNFHINGSLDFTQYKSIDGSEVTYDKVLGKEAYVTIDAVIGLNKGMPVPHFDNNRSYGNFRPSYQSNSIGLGTSIGYAEYDVSTITFSKYWNWVKSKIGN